MVKFSVNLKNPKGAKVVVSIIYPFNLPVWLLQKHMKDDCVWTTTNLSN